MKYVALCIGLFSLNSFASEHALTIYNSSSKEACVYYRSIFHSNMSHKIIPPETQSVIRDLIKEKAIIVNIGNNKKELSIPIYSNNSRITIHGTARDGKDIARPVEVFEDDLF
jgi:hypothetical protein